MRGIGIQVSLVGRGQGVMLKEGRKILVVGRKIQGVLRAVV